MRHLNYNHLLYFWTIAREGSIARASEYLHLTPQTISGQLKLLEDSVGEPLFHRVGRGLVLSDTGVLVKQYADEIFSVGAELAQRVSEKQPGSPLTVNVGIVDSIPKLIAYQMLEPVLSFDTTVKLNCREGSLEKLLAELALHKVDVVLSDRALPSGLGVKAYNHPLGKSKVGLFVQKKLASKYLKKFPASLHRAPILLPEANSAMRRLLEEWFESISIAPSVLAEFEDSALLKTFGAAGVGIFPAPVAIANEVEKMYNARLIGTATSVSETFYAISPERKLKNAAVVSISEAAHEWLHS